MTRFVKRNGVLVNANVKQKREPPQEPPQSSPGVYVRFAQFAGSSGDFHIDVMVLEGIKFRNTKIFIPDGKLHEAKELMRGNWYHFILRRREGQYPALAEALHACDAIHEGHQIRTGEIENVWLSRPNQEAFVAGYHVKCISDCGIVSVLSLKRLSSFGVVFFGSLKGKRVTMVLSASGSVLGVSDQSPNREDV